MKRWCKDNGWILVALATLFLSTGHAQATFYNFGSDPDIADSWSHWTLYLDDEPASIAWNSAGYLDASSPSSFSDNLGAYRPTAAGAWNGIDTVTLTVSDYAATTTNGHWNYLLFGVSSSATPSWGGAETYVFGLASEGLEGDVAQRSYYLRSNDGARQDAFVGNFPAAMKFDIVPDATGFSFRVNDAEVFHDTANFGVSMPYYFIELGGGANATMSARLDNFGVVPEPGMITLLTTGVVGALAYARRRQK